MAEFKKDAKGRVMDIAHFRNMFNNRIDKPDRYIPADKAIIDKYKNILPEELIYYWREYGFSSFLDGLFWLTNPDEYKELLEEYLADTPFADRKNLYVIARSAFGKLYLWESKKGLVFTMLSISNTIYFHAHADRENYSPEEENFAMNREVGCMSPNRLDENDEKKKPLFEKALKKFGKVEADEIYAYKLSPFLGGKETITNLDKMNLFNHYSIQKQFQAPTICVFDSDNNTISYL